MPSELQRREDPAIGVPWYVLFLKMTTLTLVLMTLATTQHLRREKGKQNLTLYGLATDSRYFTFYHLGADGAVGLKPAIIISLLLIKI